MDNSNKTSSSKIGKAASHTTLLQKIVKNHPNWGVLCLENNAVISRKKRWTVTDDEAVMTVWQDIKTSMRVHNWKQIKNLEFNLLHCYDVTDKVFSVLATEIGKYFTRLQTLTLCFLRRFELAGKSLENICLGAARNIPNLKQLTCSFGGCEIINDQGFDIAITSISKNLPKLEHLGLCFEACYNLSDKGIAKVSSKISRYLVALQRLELEFSECEQVTDNGLIDFAICLSAHLPKLQELSLFFPNCCQITNVGLVESLSIISKRFNKLRLLKIDFISCEEITDEGLKQFADKVLPHLAHLDQFALAFGDSDLLTDEGLVALSRGLSLYLNKLKRLSICFRSCGEITDNGLETLGFSLAYLANLEGLSLDFSISQRQGDQLTDKGFISLMSNICRNINKLTQLEIDFFGRLNITSDSLDVLGDEICQHLVSLRQFTLSLNSDRNFALDLFQLREKLSFIPDLKL